MHSLIKLTQDLAMPIGRVLLSLIFITSGWSKIGGYAGTAAYMEMMGVPGILLPLVIVVELIGGICLALGFHARLSAFLLGGFCLISGVLFHYVGAKAATDPAEIANQMVHFWKNVSIAGGMGVVVGAGAGAFSIDRMRGNA